MKILIDAKYAHTFKNDSVSFKNDSVSSLNACNSGLAAMMYHSGHNTRVIICIDLDTFFCWN